ncbi:MAG: VCBS repeat-containing protein [Planctomycetes bacterium]|nr:VCBS repeat-containing protein [Planctomycetota bacterium]
MLRLEGLLLAAWTIACLGDVQAADCNGNGVEDATDIAPGKLELALDRVWTIGTDPVALVAGDWNADGKPDLATANAGSGNVSVFLSRGAGKLAEPVHYDLGGWVPWGQVSSPLLALDLDGDGNADLAALTHAALVILRGRGDGAFDAAVRYGAGGAELLSFAAADLNGDGKPDLAAGRPDGLAMLRGRGDGSFEEATAHDVGEEREVWSVAAADLNGDGAPDLALGLKTWVRDLLHGTWMLADGPVALLLNRGDGSFEEPVVLPEDADPLTLLGAADLDGDGRPDLIASTPAPGVDHALLVFRNQADGTFEKEVVWHQESPYHNLLALDADGDGTPDECETQFHRGDPDASGRTDISDAIVVFGHLFLWDPTALPCLESADADNDGAIDISDGIYLLRWLFTGGPEPAAPGPAAAPCGVDPDATGSPGDLGCAAYPPCQQARR